MFFFLYSCCPCLYLACQPSPQSHPLLHQSFYHRALGGLLDSASATGLSFPAICLKVKSKGMIYAIHLTTKAPGTSERGRRWVSNRRGSCRSSSKAFLLPIKCGRPDNPAPVPPGPYAYQGVLPHILSHVSKYARPR